VDNVKLRPVNKTVDDNSILKGTKDFERAWLKSDPDD
jgi:hypothetical protein